jgi:osmotically-inducible protein OsmY
MKRILPTALVAFTLAFGADTKPVTDDSLYDQVRMRLTQDPSVNGGALTVDVKQGVVKLQGKVRNERARQKAEKIVRKVKGVKSVDNQLQVDPNAH